MKLFGGTITLVALLAACDDAEPRYQFGYGDRYAVGYNTACEFGATFIEGDFGNESYARGYADGVTNGIIDCNATR